MVNVNRFRGNLNLFFKRNLRKSISLPARLNECFMPYMKARLVKVGVKFVVKGTSFVFLDKGCHLFVDEKKAKIRKFTVIKLGCGVKVHVESKSIKEFLVLDNLTPKKLSCDYKAYMKSKHISKSEWVITPTDKLGFNFGCAELVRPRKGECLHYHESTVEVLFCMKNKVKLEVDGRQFVLKKGGVFIFMPYCSHRLVFDKELFPFFVYVVQYPARLGGSLSYDKIPTSE